MTVAGRETVAVARALAPRHGMSLRGSSSVLVLIVACARPSAPAAAPAARAPEAPPLPAQEEPVASAPAVPVAADVAQPREIEGWPYFAWTHAEAVVLAAAPRDFSGPFLAYDDVRGWSPHIIARVALTREQTKLAVYLARTGPNEEGFIPGPCEAPRVAVVLHARARPVGSINYTVNCGTVLLWPDREYEPGSGWHDVPIGENETVNALWDLWYRRRLAATSRQLRSWRRFFAHDLDLPLAELD